eukprot:TRINITY_DN9966_c0_g1_i1.p1 TRINITY_DN9966_c0_g1~~TRINITY_DN9966_c0_g1_i1.p1  ORF type:complete len:393 (+),score=61.39 TRINITY_DN9966_c0_g1_i1:249-1427(+)
MEGSSLMQDVEVSKYAVDTPALLLDLDKFDRNVVAMQRHALAHGKHLRPHAKTHKCSEIAKRQITAGAIGICVAKVSEAEVMVEKGVRGVHITSPVVTKTKIATLIKCRSLAPDVMVVVDNRDNVTALNAAVAEALGPDERLQVLVDVDGGLMRTGVPFDQAVDFGKFVHSHKNLHMRGVQCYLGHVQHITSFDQRKEVSLTAMEQAQKIVREFRDSGVPCEIFTGSGTGTFDIDVAIADLTEMQTGSYIMMDAEYLNVGSQENPSTFASVFQDPPLTMLTSVITCNHLPKHVTVDAGLKAMYRDGGTPIVLTHPELKLTYRWNGDEHGRVTINLEPELLPADLHQKVGLGALLEIVVSHVDPTVNLFDKIHVTRGDKVIDVWPIDCRGKCQ